MEGITSFSTIYVNAIFLSFSMPNTCLIHIDKQTHTHTNWIIILRYRKIRIPLIILSSRIVPVTYLCTTSDILTQRACPITVFNRNCNQIPTSGEWNVNHNNTTRYNLELMDKPISKILTYCPRLIIKNTTK